METTEQGRVIRRRRRLVLSCIECRRRKIKCNRECPCNHCLASGDQCVYKDKVRPPSTNGQSGQNSVFRISDVTAGNTLSSTGSPASALLSDTGGAASPYASGPVLNARLQADESVPMRLIHELMDKVQRLEKTVAHSNGSPSAPVATGEPSDPPTRPSMTISKSRVMPSDEWYGKSKQVAKSIVCFREMTGQSDGESFQAPALQSLLNDIRALLHNSKELGRQIKLERLTKQSVPSDSSVDIPLSWQEMEEITKLYFTYFESTYRILHQPTFARSYQKYSDQPQLASSIDRYTIILVLIIGSSMYSFGSREKAVAFNNVCHQCIYNTQVWFQSLKAQDVLSVPGVQIHCLLIIAQKLYNIRHNLEWSSVGSLVHTAMRIGLHRDPKHLPQTGLLEAEIRRRLWASVLELLVQAALDAEMAPLVTVADFDTSSPANLDDEDLDEFTVIPRIRREDEFTMTSMQLQILRSLPARLEVARFLYGWSSSKDYSVAVRISTDLTRVLDSSVKYLQDVGKDRAGTADSPSQHQSQYYHLALDYHIRRFVLSLHLPFTSFFAKDSPSPLSSKIAVDTALLMVYPQLEINLNQAALASIGLVKMGTRSVSVAIGMSLVLHTSEHFSSGTLDRPPYIERRNVLRRALDRLLEFEVQMLRDERGESLNVKQHTWISMVIAEAEAMERTNDTFVRELSVAQAAKESVSICHDLLRRRVNTMNRHSGPNGMSATSNVGDGFHLDALSDWEWNFDNVLNL